MHHYLNVLANLIISTYFHPTKCLYIFVDDNSIFEHNENVPAVIFNSDLMEQYPKSFTRFFCDHFVVNTATPQHTFTQIERVIRMEDERFYFRKYLILPTENYTENITDIFKTQAIDHVADVLAVIPKNIDDASKLMFTLLTHNYVGVDNNNGLSELDIWFAANRSFLHNNNLFPYKLSNMYGRKFKGGTFTYKPYSVIESLDGLEMRVVMELVRIHNMTLEILVDYENVWGDVYDNWTGNGVLGNLAMDVTDLGFAAMYMWFSYYPFLDFTKPVAGAGVTCLAPAPKLSVGWITPFLPFSTSMWVAWALSVFLSFLSIFLVLSTYLPSTGGRNTKENAIIAILQTESLFLGQSVTPLPVNLSSRLVYAFIMLLCLIIATIYNCGLASNMTVPRYEGTIKTSADLAKSGISWGATSALWVRSIDGSDNPVEQKLVKMFVVKDPTELENLNSELFGYAMERLQGGNLGIGDYVTPAGASVRRLMDDDIYYGLLCMYTRKGSMFLPLINDLLLQVTEAGLMRHWEYEAASIYHPKVQTIVKYSIHPQKPELTALSYTHLKGAYALWLTGMLASVFVFIVEIMNGRNLKKCGHDEKFSAHTSYKRSQREKM